MNSVRALLLLALFACGGSACGGSASDASADRDASAFSSTAAAIVTSDSGAYRLAVYSSPDAHPTRGVNELQVVVTNVADGSPAAVDLAVVPFMPAMGHGASVTPTVTADGDGRYTVSNVTFFMAGLWELRATLASTDHATAQFEVL